MKKEHNYILVEKFDFYFLKAKRKFLLLIVVKEKEKQYNFTQILIWLKRLELVYRRREVFVIGMIFSQFILNF